MNEMTSKTIYFAKAFAVLSVICAHCNSVGAQSNRINAFCSDFLGSLGSFGVGVFLFFGGYFLYHTKQNFVNFFRKKVFTLMIPWLFTGTLVYLYVYLRKGGLGFFSFVKWIIGLDTYLYYMTVLVLLYLICFLVRKNKTGVLICLCVSALSNVLTDVGILPLPFGYIQPLDFMIYFAAGLLVANYNFLDKIFSFCRKFRYAALIVMFVVVSLLAMRNMYVGYFDLYYIPIEIIAAIAIFGFSYKLAEKDNKLLLNIGKESFAIYLLHMPIAGIVANLFNRMDFFVLTLFRPIVVIAIVHIAIIMVNKIIPKGKVLNTINALIGMR